VMSFQASSADGLASSASRRSPGSLCTTPPGTRGPLTRQRYRAAECRTTRPAVRGRCGDQPAVRAAMGASGTI
jgi:hypothetical protein